MLTFEDLLSQEDWSEFDSAISDVRATFFKMDLIIHRIITDNSNYYAEEKDEATTENNILIKSLSVFDKNGKNDMKDMGSMDLSEGYVLLYYHDLDAVGLIDVTSKKCLINSTVDEITFHGNRYKLVGDAEVGPFQDRYAMVKLMFKKKLKNG